MTNKQAVHVLHCVDAYGVADEARKVAIKALESKDVTDEYRNAIASFSADFQLMIRGEKPIARLEWLYHQGSPRLVEDIETLDELDTKLRTGKIKIVEVE